MGDLLKTLSHLDLLSVLANVEYCDLCAVTFRFFEAVEALFVCFWLVDDLSDMIQLR